MSNCFCECCGENKKLVVHHWYELPDYVLQEKNICLRCNRILTTENILGDTIFKHLSKKSWCRMINKYNHILPRWELQVSFVKAMIEIAQDDRGIKRKGYSHNYRIRQQIIKECGKRDGKYAIGVI